MSEEIEAVSTDSEPYRTAYEPGATAYNLWVDVMIDHNFICDPFDSLRDAEQDAWHAIGTILAAGGDSQVEALKLFDALDKATRDHADVGLPGETARANANRVPVGLEPLS